MIRRRSSHSSNKSAELNGMEWNVCLSVVADALVSTINNNNNNNHINNNINSVVRPKGMMVMINDKIPLWFILCRLWIVD